MVAWHKNQPNQWNIHVGPHAVQFNNLSLHHILQYSGLKSNFGRENIFYINLIKIDSHHLVSKIVKRPKRDRMIIHSTCTLI